MVPILYRIMTTILLDDDDDDNDDNATISDGDDGLQDEIESKYDKS